MLKRRMDEMFSTVNHTFRDNHRCEAKLIEDMIETEFVVTGDSDNIIDYLSMITYHKERIIY